MGSPYKLLQNKVQPVKIKVDPDSLEYFKLYAVSKIRIAESQYVKGGKRPMNTICHFSDNSSKKFVYMTATNDDLDKETLATFRKDIDTGKAPNLAFYGKIGKSNQPVLQEHGEEYDDKLLETNKIKNEQLLKRKGDDSLESSPTEKAKYFEVP